MLGLIQDGGWAMYPLMVLLVLGIAITLERLYNLGRAAIDADEFFTETPQRLTIGEVEVGVNYVMLISTTAGLWAYNVGDTVMFTSTKPHRVVVTGRIKHFISAFGEHVIGKEVEEALTSTASQFKAQVSEFTVAPQINPDQGLPYHEWFIEFDAPPENLETFAQAIDLALQEQNKIGRASCRERV